MAIGKQVEHKSCSRYVYLYLRDELGKGYNVSMDISIHLSLYHSSMLLMALSHCFSFTRCIYWYKYLYDRE